MAPNSINDFSCSQLKYSSLGQSVKNHVSLQQIVSVRAQLELPKWTFTAIDFNKKHECSEKVVQEQTNAWLCEKEICGEYWVHDTHTNSTFLGGDLKPDFFVSTSTEFPYGEVCIAFFIDVKSGNVNPKANENIGQAAAYCIRLLELSAPETRLSAACVVTNLTEAAIVKVKRGEQGDWIFQKCFLPAKLALQSMFSVNSGAHGNMGRTVPVMINNLEIKLVKYLGSGASGVVYETHQKFAVKFFIDSVTVLKSKEKHILETLNESKPQNVCLQEVVDSDNEIVWPALLLKPVGETISPRKKFTFTRENSFFCILETLQHAHRRGIIHNDIRPENIIRMEDDKWLLINWAAAWELSGHINDSEEGENTNGFEKRAYYGCVTYTSDSVLTQLGECHESIEEEEEGKYKYVIDCPSQLSDLISLFRTMYVFTFRISNDEIDKLLNLRAKHKFIDIIDWWKQHLSQNAQDAERKLIESFKMNREGIYDTAANLARELFPEII